MCNSKLDTIHRAYRRHRVTAMRRSERARRCRPITCSAVDGGHVRLLVALAGGRGELVEPLDLLRAQLDAVRCRVSPRRGRRAWCRGSGQYRRPGQSSQANATCAGVASTSEATAPTSSTIRRFFSKLPSMSAGWSGRQSASTSSSGGADRPGEEAVPERRVGHEADAQLAQERW